MEDNKLITFYLQVLLRNLVLSIETNHKWP